MRRRKDKNKQIICIILFIFVLLSGVFYAVYTSVGKEFISKEGSGNTNVVIRNETSDNKTTVPKNEEPVVDDKPLSNKITNDNKTTNTNTTKPKKPNSNTNKPATNTNTNIVFDGLEVIRDHGNNSNNNSTGSNEQAGNGSSSSSGSSTSSQKSKAITLKLSGAYYKDYNTNLSADASGLRITAISGQPNAYLVSGTLLLEDKSITKGLRISIPISRPEAYRGLSNLTIGNALINGTSYDIETTRNEVPFESIFSTNSKKKDIVTINWGAGDEAITYTFQFDITLENIPKPQPEPTPEDNTPTEQTQD